MRTFEEIAATISTITGIPVNDTRTFGNPVSVKGTYDSYIQQLPSTEALDAFLPSHQMAIAQLALTSCSELVEADKLLASADVNRYFAGFDFTATATIAFDNTTKRNQIINPLLVATLNVDSVDPSNNLTSQPDETVIRNMLSATTSQDLDLALAGDSYESLVTEMTACGGACDTVTRTEQIVKAVCAAAVGGAVMLIQ